MRSRRVGRYAPIDCHKGRNLPTPPREWIAC